MEGGGSQQCEAAAPNSLGVDSANNQTDNVQEVDTWPVQKDGRTVGGGTCSTTRTVQDIIIVIFIILTMAPISGSQVFLVLAVLNLTTSLPVRDEYEVELRQSNRPRPPSDALLEAALRHMMSAGLDRRRQLGDIEFSNRYAEFLRSKAKHSSICAFLRRMHAVKMSAVGGDVEKVNQLLKQYMCPSVYNNWPTDF